MEWLPIVIILLYVVNSYFKVLTTMKSSITLVTASFLINIIEMGTFKSFGVLLLSMEDSLETTNASLGFTISLCPSIGYIFGKIK